ncbi:hypothetical protein [Neobacillus sp. 19]
MGGMVIREKYPFYHTNPFRTVIPIDIVGHSFNTIFVNDII